MKKIRFNLNDHGMPSLPKNWFNFNVSMVFLGLYATNMLAIETDAFNTRQFSQLETLYFDDVPLITLFDGSFNGLENLKFLRLKHGKIVTDAKNVLAPMLNLEQFIMRNCGQQKISIDNLFGTVLLHLKKVNIINCNLHDTITNSTFTGLLNVTELILTANGITQIGTKSFDVPFRTLKYLDLQSNNLKLLPRNLFNTIRTNLVSINLKSNPWHCDCELEYLRKIIKFSHYSRFYFDPIHCKTPRKLEGHALRSCPHLCEKSATLSQLRTTEDRNIHQNVEGPSPTNIESSEIDLIEDAYLDSIIIQCKSKYKPSNCHQTHREVTLTKPSPNKIPSFIIKNENIFINANGLPSNFEVFAFVQIPSKGIDQSISCSLVLNDEVTKISLKEIMDADQMYQFCRKKKGSLTVMLFDCIAYYSITNKNKKSISNEGSWSLIENKSIIIFVFVLFGVHGLVIGFLVSITLAKYFPKPIQEFNFKEDLVVKRNQITVYNQF